MTDYTKLVRDLRFCPTPYSKLLHDAADAIEALQAQLPKRGEWVKCADGLYHCSNCGTTAPYLDAFDGAIQYWENLNYCPYCGAKMGGTDERRT